LRFKPADPDKKAENAQKPASTATGPGMDGGGPRGPGGQGAGKGKKRDGQGGTVHIIADGALKPVPVQIGISDGRMTELLSGDLKEGERVVVGENSDGGKKPSSVGMRMF
jgi:HlyD family secretion protein